MRWTWRLGRVNGAPVEVHSLFALLVGWAAFTGWTSGQIVGLVYSTGLLLAIFGCILLHEIGHSLQAQALGIPVRRILLLPFGGLAQLAHAPDRPRDELRVALAGPATNLGLGLIAGALLLAWLSGSGSRLSPLLAAQLVLRRGQPGGEHLLSTLAFVNVSLVVFNLIPAFPLDGGRILRSLLALRLRRSTATRTVASLGWIVGITCLLLGGTLGRWWGQAASISLVFIGATAILGTGAEESFERNQAALHGISVRAAVQQPTWCLRPAEVLTPALLSAIEAMGRSSLPVADGPNLIGVLSRQAAVAALARLTPTTVEQVMRIDFPRVEADADLWHAQQLMAGAGWQALPVVNGGQLHGMLTSADIRAASAAPPSLLRIEAPLLIFPGQPSL
jgi:Zn-dependent protease/CBS domain-containing protein